MTIRIQEADFDIDTEHTALSSNDTCIGAVVSFVGLVRDINEGSHVSAMNLEHYPGMTEKALEKIVADTKDRWAITNATVIHRIGPLRPTDNIVFVGVSSAHRSEAFAACEFIIDHLKTTAPFWKRETTPNGSHWVDARNSDESATARWNSSSA